MIFETTINFEPTSLKRHRHTFKGGRTYDPSAKDKKKFVQLINIPVNKMDKPIQCILKFYSSRPKSHYRTGKYSHLLKNSAPKYNTSKKDVDNMAKFVLDALNNKLYVDDCQIVKLECEKLYSKDNIGKVYMKFSEIIEIDESKNDKLETNKVETNKVETNKVETNKSTIINN